jgi:hypothetical protein
MQNLKRVEKLARFLEGCGRDFGVSLTKEKLADNVCADDGRIVPQNDRFRPSIASAQQLGRAGVNENGHGMPLSPEPQRDSQAANRQRDPTQNWPFSPKTFQVAPCERWWSGASIF